MQTNLELDDLLKPNLLQMDVKLKVFSYLFVSLIYYSCNSHPLSYSSTIHLSPHKRLERLWLHRGVAAVLFIPVIAKGLVSVLWTPYPTESMQACSLQDTL